MKKGFTLLELLVVISIIIALLMMILPAMNLFKEAAKRTKARDSVHQLVAAWETYLLNNREFPDVAITKMDPPAMSNLTDYMEFATKEWITGFVDPWTNQVYQVRIDNGKGGDSRAYDGKVTGLPDRSVLKKSVAVWSMGKDGKNDSTKIPKDDVRNW